MDDFEDPLPPGEFLQSLLRLTRDLKSAAVTLTEHQARFLVDAYYSMQRDRIRSAHQVRTLAKGDEPHDIVTWVMDQREMLEKEVAKTLKVYSTTKVEGRWARSILGIGPIITAGLLAHVDITKAPTVGHLWRFAGLDPTSVWAKGEKRPHNGSLKRLCYLIGESFVKVSNNERDVYGNVYKVRKEYETAKNAAGDYADQAKASLAAKRFGADTEARKHYEAGHLPPARIHLRSHRYATKLFLSHFHHVAYENHFGVAPPRPYIFTQPGHKHFLAPPNWPMPSLKSAPSNGSSRR